MRYLILKYKEIKPNGFTKQRTQNNGYSIGFMKADDKSLVS